MEKNPNVNKNSTNIKAPKPVTGESKTILSTNPDNAHDSLKYLQSLIGNQSFGRLWESVQLQKKSALEQEFKEDKNNRVGERSDTIPEHDSGLPEKLKINMENWSHLDLSDVRAHYDSSAPALLKALAYTRGTDIHLAPGQEEHLPHEAWHVVQQKQGRVTAETQTKGLPVNTDTLLEKEADQMGLRASQQTPDTGNTQMKSSQTSGDVVQLKKEIEKVIIEIYDQDQYNFIIVYKNAESVVLSGIGNLTNLQAGTFEVEFVVLTEILRDDTPALRIINHTSGGMYTFKLPLMDDLKDLYNVHTTLIISKKTETKPEEEKPAAETGPEAPATDWNAPLPDWFEQIQIKIKGPDTLPPYKSGLITTAKDIAPLTPRDYIQFLKQEDIYFIQIQIGGKKDFRIVLNEARFNEYRKRFDESDPGNSPQAVAAYAGEILDHIVRVIRRLQSSALTEPELDLQAGDLPEAVGDLLKTRQTVTPTEYKQIMRIQEKLTPEQWDDYTRRVSRNLHNLDELEQSVDDYLKRKEKRKKEQAAFEKTKTDLYGLEDAYKLYRDMKRNELAAALLSSSRAESALAAADLRQEAAEQRKELEALLQRHKIQSIKEFEKLIIEFETGFQNVTVAVADDMLDVYDHQLFEDEQRYQQNDVIHEMFGHLAPAREHYTEMTALRQRDNKLTRESKTKNLPGSYDYGRLDEIKKEQAEIRPQIKEHYEQIKTIVGGLAENDPILKEEHLPANKRVDKAKLVSTDEPGLKKLLLDHIRERRADIRTTRLELQKDPKKIYSPDLDQLLALAKKRQNIKPGSLPDMIIEAKKEAEAFKHAVTAILVAIISIAVALLTLGGGTIAAVAAVASLGLSAMQAYEEFRDYEMKSAAAGAGLMSDDPSLVWLILAVVGAAADVAGVAQAAKTLKAVEAVSPLAKTLDATGEVSKFEKGMEALVDSGRLEARISQRVIEANKAREMVHQSVRDLTKAMSKAYSFPGPLMDPDVYRAAVKLAYYKIREGINDFAMFADQVKLMRAQAKLNDLSPEEIIRLRQAWEEAGQTAAKASTLGLDLTKLQSEKLQHILKDLSLEQTAKLNSALENTRDFSGKFINQMYEGMTSGKLKGAELDEFLDDALMFKTQKVAPTGTAPYVLKDPGELGKTAGTGGISSIRFGTEPVEAFGKGAKGPVVTIEGKVQKGMPVRAGFEEALSDPVAIGLPKGKYHKAHLWGPGFGDEAVEGIMHAPAEFNLAYQNSGIEKIIRKLQKEEYEVFVEAGAYAYPRNAFNDLGIRMRGRDLLLRKIRYIIRAQGPDGKLQEIFRVTIGVEGSPLDPKVMADIPLVPPGWKTFVENLDDL